MRNNLSSLSHFKILGFRIVSEKKRFRSNLDLKTSYVPIIEISTDISRSRTLCSKSQKLSHVSQKIDNKSLFVVGLINQRLAIFIFCTNPISDRKRKLHCDFLNQGVRHKQSHCEGF